VDLARVERLATPAEVLSISQSFSRNLDELVARRAEFLAEYQDAAYAARYRALVERVREAEARTTGGSGLAAAVARYYFKLMSYKDEYEVARLHADPAFRTRIAGMFEGEYRLNFHLAPPVFNRPDPRTGEATKTAFGPWMMTAFRVLAKFKRLRGTPFDLFGMTEETQDRAAAHSRVREDRGRASGAARAGQPRAGREDRVDSRAYPRLRARQAPPPGRKPRRRRPSCSAHSAPRRPRRKPPSMPLTRADLEKDLLRENIPQDPSRIPVLSDADQEASLRGILGQPRGRGGRVGLRLRIPRVESARAPR